MPIQNCQDSNVAPLVGAWIEIGKNHTLEQVAKSLPSWERGLKSSAGDYIYYDWDVAPLVGAWIEIYDHPYYFVLLLSLPSWERGLKYNHTDFFIGLGFRRSPRGSVD